MVEELISFDIPVNKSSIIKVLGVGGGGSNAVNYMFKRGIKDVDFVVCNTDAQALENSPVPVKIQLGGSLTEGRGAGSRPDIGKQAAIENLNDIIDVLSKNTKMVFITAGMGGGTGTGAAPVIAKAAKELNILTVAIVTIPFRFEGQKRINHGIEGIAELEKYVDSLLVINNEKLREIYGNLKISEAFSKADDILATAAKGMAEIITVPGYINVDFADVQTVMQKSGVAIMGSATAAGENRAVKAIQQALSSPLLNNNDIKGAANILLNITSGTEEVSMDEVGEITDYINVEVGRSVDIIWGIGLDERLGDKISVTIIATGFKSNSIPELYAMRNQPEKVHLLHDSPLSEDLSVRIRKNRIVVEDSVNPHQGVIEFEIDKTDTTHYNLYDGNEDSINRESVIDPVKASEKIKKIKETREQLKETGIPLPTKKINIEHLENEPAYKRKNQKIDNFKHSEETPISRYSLTEDEDKKIELKTNNSYLHDNVD